MAVFSVARFVNPFRASFLNVATLPGLLDALPASLSSQVENQELIRDWPQYLVTLQDIDPAQDNPERVRCVFWHRILSLSF